MPPVHLDNSVNIPESVQIQDKSEVADPMASAGIVTKDQCPQVCLRGRHANGQALFTPGHLLQIF